VFKILERDFSLCGSSHVTYSGAGAVGRPGGRVGP